MTGSHLYLGTSDWGVILGGVTHDYDTGTYRKHERAKIRAYEQRVREVEHGSFTPLVMSLTGGCGNAASVAYKRLASMLAKKRDSPIAPHCLQ